MRIGESIKKGFGVVNQSLNLILMLLLVSVLFNLAMSPLTLKVQSMTQGWTAVTPGPKDILAVAPFMLIFVILSILLNSLIMSGTMSFLKDKVKLGKAELPVFFTGGAKNFIKFLSLMLLTGLFGLVFILLVGLGAVVGALISAAGKGTGFVVGLGIVTTICLVLAVVFFAVYYAFLMFTFAPYLIVERDLKLFAALRESMVLVKKKFWQVAWLVTALFLIFAMIVILAVLVGILLSWAAGFIANVSIQNIIQFVVSLVFGVLFLYSDILSKSSTMIYYLGLADTTSEIAK